MKHFRSIVVAVAVAAFLPSLPGVAAAPIPTGRAVPLPGVFGRGVLAVTFLFRPRHVEGPNDDWYIVHGPHVLSFTRPHGGWYEILLDREYKQDEIVIFVQPLGAIEPQTDDPTYAIPDSGLWGGPTFGSPGAPAMGSDTGMVASSVVWGCGTLGELNKRTIVVRGMQADSDGLMHDVGNHSNPVSIMLVFLDRTKPTLHTQ